MSNNAERLHGEKNGLISAAAAMVITCEHGGNQIPPPYRYLFRDCRTLLDSHRGFDPGALVMATAMARNFSAPLLASTTSRLLVDLNRSIGHRNLHMDAVRELTEETRRDIVEQYYKPYRIEAERLVTAGIARCGRVVHISCHSFTNNLNDVVRSTDVGLLYDPVRKEEKSLCARWKSVLKESSPNLEVRRNFPYEGRNDGLTSTLRKKFPTDAYLGIELELNQKNLLLEEKNWATLRKAVIRSLDAAIRGQYRSIEAAP